MNCVLCGVDGAVAIRYGRRWCNDCCADLDFEVQIAIANGLRVVDVELRPNGVAVVLQGPGGEPLLHDDLVRVIPTRRDALNEVTQAMEALRRTMLPFRSQLLTSPEAPRRARELIEIVGRYEPLFDDELRRAVGLLVLVARRVLDVHTDRQSGPRRH